MNDITSSAHTFKRARIPVRLDIVTGWLLAVAVLALIGTVYLAQASQAAQEGVQLETLKLELALLQRENTQLEVEIALAQAPARLAERAAQLGYRPATSADLEYVVVRDYPTPVPTASAPAAVASADEDSLVAWLVSVLGQAGGGP